MHMNSIGLYIHIPFCARKCAYCDFASFAGKEHLTQRYVDHLCREIRNWGAALGATTIRTINFGGGTPSVLAAGDVQMILDSVRSVFDVPDGIEISLEANPGTGELEKFRGYVAAGINRMSFGVQSFDDSELKKLGRIHTAQEVYEAYDAARTAGVQNINLDFIFALPNQTLERWQDNLRQAISLDPDHLSTYNLQIEEGTPYYAAHQKGSLNLPDEDTELAMYEGTIAYLKEAGFHHYEISNFSKPGRECQHNLIYWHNENWLGVGSGAHGHLNGHRFANPDAIEEYLNLSDIPALCVSALETPAAVKDRVAETMMMGLRLNEGVSLPQFETRFGTPLSNFYPGTVEELRQNGLIEIDFNSLRLSPRGLPLANLVFEKFI